MTGLEKESEGTFATWIWVVGVRCSGTRVEPQVVTQLRRFVDLIKGLSRTCSLAWLPLSTMLFEARRPMTSSHRLALRTWGLRSCSPDRM